MLARFGLAEINVRFYIWVVKVLCIYTRWRILFWVVAYANRILGVWWTAPRKEDLILGCGNKFIMYEIDGTTVYCTV